MPTELYSVITMIDFESVVEYVLGGFGSGAIAYSILADAITAGASIPTVVGPAVFGTLTVLGVLGGILKGRRVSKEAESK